MAHWHCFLSFGAGMVAMVLLSGMAATFIMLGAKQMDRWER